jgi:glycosyltransferase involved in cell wall biosynthesis
MTKKPTVCVIHEAIGSQSAIAKAAMRGVYAALDAGYDVTVVAKHLEEDLQDKVTWLRLFVPRRLFLLQWTTAGYFIRKALGNRKFDIVHTHQPQVASISDIFQIHYLTRMAFLRNSLENGKGLKPSLMRFQERGVLMVEDYLFRRWNQNTFITFNSNMTRDDFANLYGKPAKQGVLLCSAPPFEPISEEERRAARAKVLGFEPKGPVLGFLGGGNARKGYQRIVEGLKGDNDVFFLMGGSLCDGMQIPELEGRFKAVGLVYNTPEFYAACDVVIMASLYEPFGRVILEAASRGLPVIVTPEVGALPHLEEYGVGVAWDPKTPLAPVVHRVLGLREQTLKASQHLAEDLSEDGYAENVVKMYAEVMRSKGLTPPCP